MGEVEYVTIKNTSLVSGITSEMTLPLTVEEFNECMSKWNNGTLIQDAFPMLDHNQREFIMTGITPGEWEALSEGC